MKWQGEEENFRSNWHLNPIQSQHELVILRILSFMLCVKIRKCETFSIRANSAMRNGP